MDNKLIIWIKDNVNLSGMQTLKKNLSEIHSKLSALKAAAKETWEVFKGAASLYFAPLKAVAVPALAAVTTAFGLAIKAVREFAGQELGERDVTSALIAMGQYTDQYRDQLIKLSDTYQTTTGIADDMWLKSLAQLTRFGMNASNVDRVSEALKNLTGLMDGNLDGATDMLAKAMQGEFGMFSRYGIIIKQTGDQVKDLDAAITAINAKGVGLLEARSDTLSGKWTGMKNQANEVFEAIGKKLSSSLDIGDAITTAKGWLATLTSAVQSGGLGELISKGGKELKEHIEGAVKWAEKIADAIKASGKPVEQVFSDALKAAAKVLLDAIAAGLQASLEIWKVIGKTIAATFKEEILQLPGFGSMRKAGASSAAASMSPEDAGAYYVATGKSSASHIEQALAEGVPLNRSLSRDFADGGFNKQQEASMAATTSASEITAAFSAFKTAVSGIATTLGAEVKTAVETAAGVSPDGTKSAGKSIVTTTDANGNEVTMALEEYIAQLSAQNDKVAEAVNAGTDQAATTTETIEGATKAVEESTKTLEAVKTSHTSIETTMRSAAAAATATSQVGVQTVQVTQQVIATQALQAGILSSLQGDIARINAQLRSMRA